MNNITRAAYASAVVFAAACAHPTSHMQPEPMPAPVPPAAPPAGAQPASPVAQTGSARSSRPAARKTDSSRVSSRDVARRSVEVFGDTATAPTDEEASGPSWDIDVESYATTASVERYVRLFSGPAKARVQSWLSRGTQYEAMIRGKMREGGIPEDMYYLALIESGFDPNAYSRAAAVGMWQFMTSTGRDMGLRIDWWVDERRDPFKATTAAVRFIKGLNEQFGSLYLAAAAYNGGPGRVSRGLTRYADDLEGTSGDDLFFALADRDYFRNETREYVPQLIAAALIAKDPERYGMQFDSLPAVTYDSVRVGPATPIAAIARASNQTVARVLQINPHVLRGITPPADSYFVRLPVGQADSFPAAFDALPLNDRVGLRTVHSKKGETLETIARREGLSARQLSMYNPKLTVSRNGTLAVGQSVVVPSADVVSAAVAVPDPAIERYGSSRPSATHVVKSGETLSGIAARYHTTTAALMKSNGLKRPLIFPGQSLAVGGSAPAVKSAIATKAPEKSKVVETAGEKSRVADKTAEKSKVADKTTEKSPVAGKTTEKSKVASVTTEPKSKAAKSASPSKVPVATAAKISKPASTSAKVAKTPSKPTVKSAPVKAKSSGSSKSSPKRID